MGIFGIVAACLGLGFIYHEILKLKKLEESNTTDANGGSAT